MTTSEAIAWFEDCVKDGYCVIGPTCPQCNAERIALSALREKQKKDHFVGVNKMEDSCADCNYFSKNNQWLCSVGNGKYIEKEYTHCPMCGRPLKGG